MKIIYVIFLALVTSLGVYGQILPYNLLGKVEVVWKNYDFKIPFMDNNEKAELLLIIHINGQEYAREGPAKNDNSEIFSFQKIKLDATDTIQIDCYDFDENNIFTLGLNFDDFICTFKLTVSELLANHNYEKLLTDGNKLSIYTNSYFTGKITVRSFTINTDRSKKIQRVIKKGMLWKFDTGKLGEISYTSSIQKPKKGIVTWSDSFVMEMYNTQTLNISTNIYDDDQGYENIKFLLSAKPGIQQIYTHYGIFEVEVTLI